ncbi:MAG: hypothetical protein ABIQ55_09125 [Gemmatimonadaceae bacterium]
MDLTDQDILAQYLAGTLDLQSAAEALSMLREYALWCTPPDITPAERERIEELFARTLWLTLREHDPANVPDEPFGAADIRAMADGSFFDAESD